MGDEEGIGELVNCPLRLTCACRSMTKQHAGKLFEQKPIGVGKVVFKRSSTFNVVSDEDDIRDRSDFNSGDVNGFCEGGSFSDLFNNRL